MKCDDAREIIKVFYQHKLAQICMYDGLIGSFEIRTIKLLGLVWIDIPNPSPYNMHFAHSYDKTQVMLNNVPTTAVRIRLLTVGENLES